MLIPKLPYHLIVNQKKYRIETDFRRWMDLQQLFVCPKLTEAEKQNIALINTYGEIPQDIDGAMEQAFWFLAAGEPIPDIPPPERLLDWQQDYFAIWGDFRIYANMDIRRVKYMHWWEFLAIFRSLPHSSQIKHRIHIRGIDLNTIKDSKVKEEYRQQKELFALESIKMGSDNWYNGIK